VDDTGARHQAKNGFCTHIGNDHFAFFTTTSSKSRLNFLEVVTAGDTTHLINDAAIGHMRDHNLSGIVINQLAPLCGSQRNLSATNMRGEQRGKPAGVTARHAALRADTVYAHMPPGGSKARCVARRVVVVDEAEIEFGLRV
jgi:hypothetical protein